MTTSPHSNFMRRGAPFKAALVSLFTVLGSGLLHGQITVPDRLPNGERMPVLTTPADKGVLAYDTLRTLPVEEGGRDSWWHRHALFMDGPVQLALDPVVDLSLDRRKSGDETMWQEGYRNVRGVRYAGQIDGRVAFGGKVLEMQRLLVSPETQYVLNAQAYPGMGTGKLRPAEGGLYSLDHSLAEVWFDTRPSKAIRVQWGLGASGLGPGARNLLWTGNRGPSPYLLIEGNLGKGWTYRWVQSRQKGPERLPADGAREGRYRPLGLGIRSLTKTITFDSSQLDITWMCARWTDVGDRSDGGQGFQNNLLAMAPWALPTNRSNPSPWYLAGHQGLDMQWRRPKSTWYGQLRVHPSQDMRYKEAADEGSLEPVQFLLGHVRHGQQWSTWTELSSVAQSAPPALSPGIAGLGLGLDPWSPLAPCFVQGAEWGNATVNIAAEFSGFPSDMSLPLSVDNAEHAWKFTVSLPTRAAASYRERPAKLRRRWGPALVPIAPFVSIMTTPNAEFGLPTRWWSMGITTPCARLRKTH